MFKALKAGQAKAHFLYQAMSDLSLASDFESNDRSSLPFRLALGQIVNGRWYFLHSDWLYAAYLLNPWYWHLVDNICDRE